MTATYSDESIAEVKNFLKKKRAYVGTDGKPLSSVATDNVNLFMFNWTGP